MIIIISSFVKDQGSGNLGGWGVLSIKLTYRNKLAQEVDISQTYLV